MCCLGTTGILGRLLHCPRAGGLDSGFTYGRQPFALFDGISHVYLREKWTLGDFVSSAGNFITITLVHVKKVINKAVVRVFGHFDNEIDFADSEGSEGMKVATSSLRSVFRPT